MNKNLEFEIVDIKDIEICRYLCDELMSYQKSKAILFPEAFNGMNFDTRMKKSCENTVDSQIIICKDKDKPIGYAFSTIETASKESAEFSPEWAPKSDSAEFRGFYPDWLEIPQKIGCLSNIYIKDEYRGIGLGYKFIEKSLSWLRNFSEVKYILVYISNGNDDALKFYQNNGFKFSHDVFGGFITAMFTLAIQ
ncbi:MAG: GNAT family N-acetyltransferase [Defluviitaleaceae bacterium]|nr:GNAT family N-acetyltransferase [Defluviitaleaceae bacterium]